MTETIKCTEKAIYRYTWPGSDESIICEECAIKLQGIASVMGLYLQMIPLSELDLKQGLECMQHLKQKEKNKVKDFWENCDFIDNII